MVLFSETILEDLDIPDVLHMNLVRTSLIVQTPLSYSAQLKLHRQAHRVICCSDHIKYRVGLFLAGVEDSNHYTLGQTSTAPPLAPVQLEQSVPSENNNDPDSW